MTDMRRTTYYDLWDRRALVDAATSPHEVRLLDALTDVAEFTTRISDKSYSSEYRAFKSDSLMRAGSRVRREAFLALIGTGPGDSSERSIAQASELAEDAETCIGAVLRACAEGRPLRTIEADELRAVARRLTELADVHTSPGIDLTS